MNVRHRDTVVERKGGGRERMRDIMSATVKQNKAKQGFEEYQVAPGVRPEKGHLTPVVKIANELICEHIWDKLYPPFL
jgi:hypothetical protein